MQELGSRDALLKLDVTKRQNLVTLVPEVTIRGANLSDVMTTKRLQMQGVIAVVVTPQMTFDKRLQIAVVAGGAEDAGDGLDIQTLILGTKDGVKLCVPGLCRTRKKDEQELRGAFFFQNVSSGANVYKLDVSYAMQWQYQNILLPGRVLRESPKRFSITPTLTFKEASSAWSKIVGADLWIDVTLRFRLMTQLRYGIGAAPNTATLLLAWHPLP